MVAIREKFQDFLAVIADGGEFNALLFESRDCALQLNQLPFAERSPVGGTKKQQNRTVRPSQRVEGLHAAELIVRRKGGSLLTDGKSNGHGLERSDVNRILVESSASRHHLPQMSGSGFLRLQAVYHPVRIVVESQLCAWRVFEAFGRFRESFVCIATAINNDAGPCGGLVRLPSRKQRKRQSHGYAKYSVFVRRMRAEQEHGLGSLIGLSGSQHSTSALAFVQVLSVSWLKGASEQGNKKQR